MQQVLFWLPIKFGWFPNGIPIYGFGAMLFCAFLACILLVSRWAKREGMSADRIYDLALWIFGFGVIGARIVFMIQYKVPWQNFFKIWEGGIVFYGSAVGGWVGFAIAYYYYKRKGERIDTWKVADIVAPAVCLGLMIGRVGCLLNGCCYGNVCTTDSNCLHFPTMTAPARERVVYQGYQTLAGFSLDRRETPGRDRFATTVGFIEPGSPAAAAGLQPGDVIRKVNGTVIESPWHLVSLFDNGWPRGVSEVTLQIDRAGRTIDLPSFVPVSLPLHPTQVYESFSMFLLFLVLLAFHPFRRHYGQSFVILMIGYAIHRFFNETLRNDTSAVLGNLTLSQVVSIAVVIAAVGLELYLRRFSRRVEVSAGPSAAPAPAG
jgi:phosphatidylglycerol:prolipoprotein diacylglycerol transferase